MTNMVAVHLDDNTVVYFEAIGDLVAEYSDRPVSLEGKLARLTAAAEAMQVVCAEIREKAKPDKISLEFSLGVSGKLGWFFASAQNSGSVKATLTWDLDRPDALSR
ncbi:CU044_2847 family protein [Mycobacterium sp. UM_Kg27]|uniref:CU044_2847 family protein n=1 Tax=Mycobacterium sp. UM_Kg27 TaxID=1545693 RepID=UPI00061B0CEF|nr:CU044_2847 family protein [Mycobacterium sp. UM_Kg27]